MILALVLASLAGEPKLPAGYSCDTVRQYVQQYGYWPALLWARANGFSAAEIEAAKRCLKRNSG